MLATQTSTVPTAPNEFTPSRRTVAKGLAWMTPAIIAASAAPAYAVSCDHFGRSWTSHTTGTAASNTGSGNYNDTSREFKMRYYYPVDNAATGAATTNNWHTLTRTLSLSNAVPGVTYTFELTAAANYGNWCSSTGYPAALYVETSANSGATYTAQKFFRTRPECGTTPPADERCFRKSVLPNLSTLSWGGPTVPTIATTSLEPPASSGTCTASAVGVQYTTAAFTVSIKAETTTINFRYTWYVQSRRCSNWSGTNFCTTSGNVNPNDDIGISDPVLVKCAAS